MYYEDFKSDSEMLKTYEEELFFARYRYLYSLNCTAKEGDFDEFGQITYDIYNANGEFLESLTPPSNVDFKPDWFEHEKDEEPLTKEEIENYKNAYDRVEDSYAETLSEYFEDEENFDMDMYNANFYDLDRTPKTKEELRKMSYEEQEQYYLEEMERKELRKEYGYDD